MTTINELITPVFGSLVILAVIIACLFGLNAILLKYQIKNSRNPLRRQLIMLVVTIIAVFLLVLQIPDDNGQRGQILGLIGIVLSASIALSSTTFLGNALAGILLRSVRSFRTGDFIYINDQFGRVSDRGLFHIEIQTEDSDLVTLPNLYVTNDPVKVTRNSGTLISSEVSLGYDLSHSQIKSLLSHAATEAGLRDPFVYILKLGDFSILYRVNGMLDDVKQLLSTRSRLNGAILDALHGADIEIVSPNFMNTREVTGLKFVAQSVIRPADPVDGLGPEDIIFEKANQAATLVEQKSKIAEIETELEALKEQADESENDEKTRLTAMIDRLQKQHAQLEQIIVAGEKEIEKEKPLD